MPSNPRDLIALARERVEQKQLSETSYRRAVSDAYYAVFMTLTESGSKALLPPGFPQEAAARAFEHKVIGKTFQYLMSDNKTKAGIQYKGYFSAETHDILHKMAITFLRLQNERYTVDYNHAIDYPADKVSVLLSKADEFIAMAELLEQNHRTDFQNLAALLLLRKTSNIL